MKTHESVALEILREGMDDWVMIDDLLWYARAASMNRGDEFKEVFTGSLNFLLSNGLAQVGDLGESGFEAWAEDIPSAINRAVANCEALNWEPQGGARCWLSNTPAGNSFAEKNE